MQIALNRPAVRVFTRNYRSQALLDVTLCTLALPSCCCFLECVLYVWLDDPGPSFLPSSGPVRGRRSDAQVRTMVVNAEELKQVYAHLNEILAGFQDHQRSARHPHGAFAQNEPEAASALQRSEGRYEPRGPRPTSFSADIRPVAHRASRPCRGSPGSGRSKAAAMWISTTACVSTLNTSNTEASGWTFASSLPPLWRFSNSEGLTRRPMNELGSHEPVVREHMTHNALQRTRS